MFRKLFKQCPSPVYDHHCMTIALHSRSHVRIKRDYFLTLQYLGGHYLSYYIQNWHNGRFMDALYAHARFDDLDLDARSQWVGNCKTSALHTLGN